MSELGTGMNVVDLVTKLGSFGLIIYVAVRLVPHVVSFLDEQRKALASIAANVVETHAVIRASEASIVKHVGDQARDVRHPLRQEIVDARAEILADVQRLESEMRAQIGDMKADTARRFHNIRELVIWLGRRTGAELDEGSAPPPPMSEREAEQHVALPDLLEETLDRTRPSQEPVRQSVAGRPPSARVRRTVAG